MRNNSQILHGDQTRSTRIGWLVYWHLTALSAQTGYIVPQEGRGQVKHTTKQWNNTINRESHTLRPGLYGDDLLASRHDYASFRSLSSQSFSKYWQFNQNNQRQNTYKRKLTRHKKEGPNKQQHFERGQTEPGLVSFYCPGNAAGLFLQPRSLHGARHKENLYRVVHQCKRANCFVFSRILVIMATHLRVSW